MEKVRKIVISMFVLMCMMAGYAPTVINATTDSPLPQNITISSEVIRQLASKDVRSIQFNVYADNKASTPDRIANTIALYLDKEYIDSLTTETVDIPLKEWGTPSITNINPNNDKPIIYEMSISASYGNIEYVTMQTAVGDTPDFVNYQGIVDLEFETDMTQVSPEIQTLSLWSHSPVSMEKVSTKIIRLLDNGTDEPCKVPIVVFNQSEYSNINAAEPFIERFFSCGDDTRLFMLKAKCNQFVLDGTEEVSAASVKWDDKNINLKYEPQVSGGKITAVKICTSFNKPLNLVKLECTLDGKQFPADERGRMHVICTPADGTGENISISAGIANFFRPVTPMFGGTYNIQTGGTYKAINAPNEIIVSGGSATNMYIDFTKYQILTGSVVNMTDKPFIEAKVELWKIDGYLNVSI